MDQLAGARAILVQTMRTARARGCEEGADRLQTTLGDLRAAELRIERGE